LEASGETGHLGEEPGVVELEISELAAKDRKEKSLRMKRHAKGESGGILGKYDDFEEIEKINKKTFDIEA
jgi:hypothetical protein